MIPLINKRAVDAVTFPRTRGDDPRTIVVGFSAEAFSPHPRG